MKIKQFLVALALAGAATASAQTDLATLVGKPVTDPLVADFVNANKLDANTGLSYENGVQVFHDGKIVYEISLFNQTSLNGNPMKPYKGVLPHKITFKDTPATLTGKLGTAPTQNGDRLLWNMKDHVVEVAYADENKTEIAYILLEKK